MPAGDAVRPTQDRVREALFSMLMDVVPGAAFLDLFAGSGAVGFDALSRGAKSATWVEIEPRHLKILEENRAAVAPGAGEVCRLEATTWVRGPGKGRAFDVAFADPPYAWAKEHGFREIMEAMAAGDVVRAGGFFVAEMPEEAAAESVGGWELLRDRRYGHTRLALYQRKA